MVRRIQRHPIQSVQNEICSSHLGQAAIGRLCTGKGSVFGELVHGLAAPAYTEILAALTAHRDARFDIIAHLEKAGLPRQIDERIAIDVPQHEVTVFRVIEAEQFRRKGRDVASPIHADNREGLDQLVVERRALRSDHLPYRVLNFADESNLAGSTSRQPPEFVQKPVVCRLYTSILKGL